MKSKEVAAYMDITLITFVFLPKCCQQNLQGEEKNKSSNHITSDGNSILLLPMKTSIDKLLFCRTS